MLLLHFLAAGSAVADCIDYGEYMHALGRVPTLTSPTRLALSDGYAYVADSWTPSGDGFLRVIDYSTNPETPQVVGSLRFSEPRCVAVSGHVAYVGGGYFAFSSVDITDPSMPRLINWTSGPGAAVDAVVCGHIAYVVGSGGPWAARDRLALLDVARPDSMFSLGAVLLPGSGLCGGIAISGDRAYVGGGPAGLQVVDISDPYHPHIVGAVDTPGSATDVAIAGNLAYVADGTSIQVIDIQSLQVVGSTAVGSPGASCIEIAGDIAYAGPGNLLSFDISNPSCPQLMGVVGATTAGGNVPGEVVVSGSLACVASGSVGFQVFDVSNPHSPPSLGSLEAPLSAASVAVSSNFAYVAGNNYFHVIDLTNPSLPSMAGSVYSYSAQGPAISGSYAYVPASTAGLRVINISQPASPQIVGSVDTPGTASGVCVSGNLALVADGGYGLQAINVTQPTLPQIVGAVDTPGYALSVEVSGTFAYVADGPKGLQVIDISQPGSPQLVGAVDTPGYAYGVAISGNFAYVADQISGLQVIDITQPTSPQIAATVDTPGYAYSVTLSGTIAYVADNTCGLQVIDVSQPALAHIIGSVDTPGSASGVAASDGCVVIADGASGLRILSVQCDPAAGIGGDPLATASQPLQLFPNPCTRQATLRVALPRTGPVTAFVLDAAGRLRRGLHDGVLGAGEHELRWDGLDAHGRPAASGIYWVRVTTEDGVKAGRLTLIR